MTPASLNLNIEPVANIRSFLRWGFLLSMEEGPNSDIYFLLARPLRNVFRRRSHQSPGSRRFAPKRQSYRILKLVGNRIECDLILPPASVNLSGVQPLSENRLVVYSARSSYRGPDNYDLNGKIMTWQGEVVRSILLGDGISNLQTDRDDLIWVGYFDEGVYGNLGWHQAVGAPGIIAWDAEGHQRYQYDTEDRVDVIDDCYGLNVESERTVWTYYYSQLPLVRIHDRQISDIWKVPSTFSSCFAIDGDLVLFSPNDSNGRRLQLLELGSNQQTTLLADVKLLSRNHLLTGIFHRANRADQLTFLKGGTVYRISVAQVAALIGR